MTTLLRLSSLGLLVATACAMEGPAASTAPEPTPASSTQGEEPIIATLGETDQPFHLGNEPSDVTVAIHVPPHIRRISLWIRGMRSTEDGPSYAVYLDLPAGETPGYPSDYYAGSCATYGLRETSRTPDGGLGYSFDITELYERLSRAPGWDPDHVRITFVPDEWDAPASIDVRSIRFVGE